MARKVVASLVDVMCYNRVSGGQIMTVTIELSPEVEAGLSALASAQDVAVSEYLQHLIEERVPSHSNRQWSVADRIAMWEDVKDLPVTPLLSDEAISREAMYGPRG